VSGIRNARPVEEVSDLQDILYEIVAAGVVPENSSARLEQIELFLHQHARDPKPRVAFEAFFEGHDLSLTAPRFVTLASGAPSPAPLPEVGPGPRMLPVAVERHDEDPTQPRVQFASIPIPAEPPRRPIGLWLALAGTLLMLGAAVFVGYTEVQQLRGELQQAKAAGDSNSAVIRQLEDDAVTLQSSIAANGEVIRSMDQKSDLIIETLSTSDDH